MWGSFGRGNGSSDRAGSVEKNGTNSSGFVPNCIKGPWWDSYCIDLQHMFREIYRSFDLCQALVGQVNEVNKPFQ